MADTSQHLNDDESLEIATKNFQRLINAASKRGYREGSVTGSDHILQRGFDLGYADAFDVAFALGKYKSRMHMTQKTIEHPVEIRTALEKTRRSACYICKLEQEINIEYPVEKSLTYIMNGQKEESDKVLGKLDEYFNLLIK